MRGDPSLARIQWWYDSFLQDLRFAVVLLVGWLPARQAARVDPGNALRED